MAVLTLVLAATAGCVDDAAPTASRGDALPVVLDYSPTQSDIGALLYLAARPDVDLLAVTLPGTGEADCEPGTRNTRQLLAIAGSPDVPVGCGRVEPLKGHRDWPDEWRREANKLPRVQVIGVEPQPVLDAEAMLADVLRAAEDPVTIVAVGPLTNIAVTLTEHPELTSRIARVVIMGGAVDVDGNVPDAPSAEWNLYVDPEAARLVVESGVPILLVPLDATNDVPFGRDVVLRLSLLETPIGRAEYQRLSAQTWFDGAYMWDELTAVAAMRPETVTVEQRRIVVDADGATVPRDDGIGRRRRGRRGRPGLRRRVPARAQRGQPAGDAVDDVRRGGVPGCHLQPASARPASRPTRRSPPSRRPTPTPRRPASSPRRRTPSPASRTRRATWTRPPAWPIRCGGSTRPSTRCRQPKVTC